MPFEYGVTIAEQTGVAETYAWQKSILPHETAPKTEIKYKNTNNLGHQAHTTYEH